MRRFVFVLLVLLALVVGCGATGVKVGDGVKDVGDALTRGGVAPFGVPLGPIVQILGTLISVFGRATARPRMIDAGLVVGAGGAGVELAT